MGKHTTEQLSIIIKFWSGFSKDPLYDTGFADLVEWSGILSSSGNEQAIKAMAYLKGAADMARIANQYMTPGWQIAHLLGTAAGVLSTNLDSSAHMIESMCETYVAELKGLLYDQLTEDVKQ